MSRLYNISITIEDVCPTRCDAIKEAVNVVWRFNDWFDRKTAEALFELTASNDGSLAGGESEKELAQELVEAVWKANGKFCPVTVDATCLTDLPYESCSFEEEDYQRLKSKTKERKK